MNLITHLDPDKHVLGRLCKYGHDWEQTGQSARYKHNKVCIVCKREHYHQRMTDPDYAVRKRASNLSANRKRYKQNREKSVKSVSDYNKHKRQNDPYFALVDRLRGRVRRAFNQYTKTGKIRTSKEYGIDYHAIIAHIGPCPGNRADYHVDHIVALSKFDLTDPEQIKIAFAPKNHQWLLAADNIRKGNK